MKALLCKQFGPPQNLVIEDIAEPVLQGGQVRIAVRACGVNFADLLMIAGEYQVRPPLPFSPGFEFAGRVTEVADDVVDIEPGQRVLAASFFGGMAEYACVPSNRVIPLPQSIDYVPAAAFLVAYGTAYHALRDRAGLEAGETLVVLGAAGGVGLAAVDIGKQMGATVIAAASTDDKLALARNYGADHLINYSQSGLKESIREMTAERGADVICDPVGGELFEQCLRAVAWGGRILVIGFTSGRISMVPANLPLLKGASIVGVYYGRHIDEEPVRNAASIAELLRLLESGRINPHVSATLTLEDSVRALETVAARRAKGKIVIQL